MAFGGKYELIQNYIYMYHTKTFILIPQYPESTTDSMSANFSSTPVLSRSAPIFAYSNSGPRTLQVSLSLHRDMMNMFNLNVSNLKLKVGEDYIDTLVNQIQAIALPSYTDASKMVNPPIIALRFGNDIFIKGVVQGGVSVTRKPPILQDNKYALIDISFNVSEIEPYDAQTVMQNGSFRGLNTTLESNVWKTAPSGFTSSVR